MLPFRGCAGHSEFHATRDLFALYPAWRNPQVLRGRVFPAGWLAPPNNLCIIPDAGLKMKTPMRWGGGLAQDFAPNEALRSAISPRGGIRVRGSSRAREYTPGKPALVDESPGIDRYLPKGLANKNHLAFRAIGRVKQRGPERLSPADSQATAEG
jgi:hypothetical protein